MTLFERAPLLESLLAPYPDVKIVLSTSWVRTYGCCGVAKHLPPGLRDRVIGATFHRKMKSDQFIDLLRGEQVIADVSRREPSVWLALDDADKGWTDSSRQRVVITDEVLGISAPGAADRIREAMAGEYSPT